MTNFREGLNNWIVFDATAVPDDSATATAYAQGNPNAPGRNVPIEEIRDFGEFVRLRLDIDYALVPKDNYKLVLKDGDGNELFSELLKVA